MNEQTFLCGVNSLSIYLDLYLYLYLFLSFWNRESQENY